MGDPSAFGLYVHCPICETYLCSSMQGIMINCLGVHLSCIDVHCAISARVAKFGVAVFKASMLN